MTNEEVNNEGTDTMNEQKKQIIDLVNKIKYEVSEQQLAELAGCATPLTQKEFCDFHAQIDELDLSDGPSWLNGEVAAQLRAVLHRVADWTREVGGKMVPCGQRIMEFAREMVRRFPKTSKALVMLAVLAFVVAHIPLVGGLLQPIVISVGMAITGLIFLNESLHNLSLNGIN